jgi:hypothetical protein
MRTLLLALITVSILTLSSCATLFQGGPDKIPVSTSPEGARVYLNNNLVGTTPCTVTINHNEDANIRLEKDGYNTIQMNQGKVLSGAFVADVISLVGGVIDLCLSNQGHYPADPIYVQLGNK